MAEPFQIGFRDKLFLQRSLNIGKPTLPQRVTLDWMDRWYYRPTTPPTPAWVHDPYMDFHRPRDPFPEFKFVDPPRPPHIKMPEITPPPTFSTRFYGPSDLSSLTIAVCVILIGLLLYACLRALCCQKRAQPYVPVWKPEDTRPVNTPNRTARVATMQSSHPSNTPLSGVAEEDSPDMGIRIDFPNNCPDLPSVVEASKDDRPPSYSTTCLDKDDEQLPPSYSASCIVELELSHRNNTPNEVAQCSNTSTNRL